MGRRGNFTSRNIDKYLNRLSEVMINMNVGPHEILLVGGAAIALKYGFGRQTNDIDICFKSQNMLYACCKIVANQYGLPDDWINADVMHSQSFSSMLFNNATLVKIYRNILYVYVVSDIDLLCMKLVASRPKDLYDIRKYAKLLKKKGITYQNIIDEFKYLYGNTFLLNQTAEIHLRRYMI